MRRRTRQWIRTLSITAIFIVVLVVLAWTFRTPLLELLPTPPIVITETSQGQTVNLLEGQRLEVHLPLNSYGHETWLQGLDTPYLRQVGSVTFTPAESPSRPGDGYEAITFVATKPGAGPLILSLLPDTNQNSITPSEAFRVVVVVR